MKNIEVQDGIFVSYSHRDSKIVERIVETLKETSGQEVWFDYKLRGGENYFSVIAEQILKNKYFVFIVSTHSVESDWCIRELEFAASEGKHIIAIWLDNIDVPPGVKLIIQNTHYVNWYSTTGNFFSRSVELAFKEDNVPKETVGTDDAPEKEQKYFLGKDERKRLADLLQAEADGMHSLCFEPENANLLGIAYELGLSVEVDLKKAELYYKASKHSGNVDGQFLHASLELQIKSERQKYLSDMMLAAKKGSVEAPPELGDPNYGEYEFSSSEKAYKYYERAATKNKSEMQECCSDMIQAAENGSVFALTRVGDFCYNGENEFPVDKEKAYKYYELAAKKNDAKALYYTAYGYRHGEVLPQDPELAYIYTLKSMEKEFPRAYRMMGYMYEGGDWVERDYKKAIELFDEAIRRGDYLSYAEKGYLYGKLGQLDKKVECYKKAGELAEKGEIKSGIPFYRLGVLYETGDGVNKNLELAVQYYLKAAERKHKRSIENVVLDILTLDEDKKLQYLQRAHSLNCKGAASALGEIEETKRTSDAGMLSDIAIKYYESGAETGDLFCVLKLINYYSCAITDRTTLKHEDRSSAIKWLSFLFANSSFVQEMNNLHRDLSAYYYAYAIELDYDPDTNKPDREFVLYYFRKAIEENPSLIPNIVHLAVNGYLFPDKSNSRLTIDVLHAEELLKLVADHFSNYYSDIKKKHSEEVADDKLDKLVELLQDGYFFIAKCYKKGKYVAKDTKKAREYHQFAKNIFINLLVEVL